MNDQRLTVLQVLPALEQGGVERGVIEIDNALVKAGWNSIVVSNGGRMEKQLLGKHLKLPTNSKNPLKILLNAHFLKFVIKENKVDIVHARSRAPAWSAYLAAKSSRAKFVTTFHGTYGLGSELKRKYNSVMTKGVRVIAVSEFIKKHIIENYKIPEAQIVTIQRGADLEQFRPDVLPMGLGLPKGKKVVMLPGRISRWKGQHIFVEAMRGVDAIGVIVGDAESYKYMQELEKTLPDNVVILPGTLDLPPVLANADIVVSASIKPEAFGRIAVEAQSMGRPVIATNIGGTLETVIDGKTGIHVPPNDVEAMRAAITKLLDSAGSMYVACVENASNFSTEKMCARTIELYKSLLA